MASLIVKEQNPANLMVIRNNFYDLLNHCIPANMILRVANFDATYIDMYFIL